MNDRLNKELKKSAQKSSIINFNLMGEDSENSNRESSKFIEEKLDSDENKSSKSMENLDKN